MLFGQCPHGGGDKLKGASLTTNSSDLVVDGSPKNQRNTQDRYAGLESLVKKGVRGAVSARG